MILDSTSRIFLNTQKTNDQNMQNQRRRPCVFVSLLLVLWSCCWVVVTAFSPAARMVKTSPIINPHRTTLGRKRIAAAPYASRSFEGTDEVTTTSSSPVPTAVSFLTDYLAASHEEKIRALQTLQAQHRAELQALEAKYQAELQQARSGQTSQPPMIPTIDSNINANDSTDNGDEYELLRLRQTVQAYRDFLSKYVVQAQEEKMKAVREAEHKVRLQYEEIIAQMKKDS